MARFSKIAAPAIYTGIFHPFIPLRCYNCKFDARLLKRLSSTLPDASIPTVSRLESRIEHNFVDGVEPLHEYTPGGYHPIVIGDVLHNRYRIVNKPGFGGYSTVWLARDTRLERGRYVAVKVGIAAPESNTVQREIRALRALSAGTKQHPGRDSILPVLDEFMVNGPNGVHTCYATEPARCNLHDASFSQLFTLEVARALVGGLTQAVAYIHPQGYVHGCMSDFVLLRKAIWLMSVLDIHLQNILLKPPPSFRQLSTEQLYEDYGKPDATTIIRRDGKPISPNVQREAVVPLYLGKWHVSSTWQMQGSSLVTLGKHLHQPQKFVVDKTATRH